MANGDKRVGCKIDSAKTIAKRRHGDEGHCSVAIGNMRAQQRAWAVSRAKSEEPQRHCPVVLQHQSWRDLDGASREREERRPAVECIDSADGNVADERDVEINATPGVGDTCAVK